jgi:hypothetical protein
MIKKFVCGLLVLSSFGFGLLWAADAFTGTWKLNVAKSKFAKGQEIKELTATVVEQGDNSMVMAKGTDGAGKPISTMYTLPLKGGPITYSEGGPPAGTTVMNKRVNANTGDSTSTKDGKQVATTHTVVSADGKTLTQTRKSVDAEGKAVTNVAVYDRQ